MAQQTIIIVVKDGKTYAFGSIKKAGEVFKWINVPYMYKKMQNSKNKRVVYKDATIERIDFY